MCVCITSSLSIFIHSSIDGHLRCLYILTIINNATMNIEVHVSFRISGFFLNKFIYLFLVALGLCCCTRAFSSCGERGLLFGVVCWPLIAVASLGAEHGL